MVLRDGLLLIGLGVAIGLPLSLAAGRISASLLYGVKPNDPLTFVLTIAVLLAIGVLAAFIPARRAAAVEPIEELRPERGLSGDVCLIRSRDRKGAVLGWRQGSPY